MHDVKSFLFHQDVRRVTEFFMAIANGSDIHRVVLRERVVLCATRSRQHIGNCHRSVRLRNSGGQGNRHQYRDGHAELYRYDWRGRLYDPAVGRGRVFRYGGCTGL